jgi:predicted transporter
MSMQTGISDFNFILAQNHMPAALSHQLQIALAGVGWQARLLLALLTALLCYLARRWHSSPRDDSSALSSLFLLVRYPFGSGSAATFRNMLPKRCRVRSTELQR